MPAWMTSLLRELVSVPIALAASSTMTSRPVSARQRATARPTTPAPMTTQSIFSATCSSADFLEDGEPAVGQIGDQHGARRVGNAEIRFGLGDHGLRRHAASPE